MLSDLGAVPIYHPDENYTHVCENCVHFKMKSIDRTDDGSTCKRNENGEIIEIYDIKGNPYSVVDVNLDYHFSILYCDAFPDGIPEDLYFESHKKPRPDLGQKNEVVFEPKTD
ncbi:MAG: hypothetical protein FWG98_06645 [Candidatus Cloacimonetes bacterium]|nr:hypothetical protein [Candidatus Cloacimonadota bacterium]